MSKTKKSSYVIGLMSGTSADGIDGVILEISEQNTFTIHGSVSHPYSNDVRKRIRKLVSQKITNAEESAGLDGELAHLYAAVTKDLLEQASHKNIDVIGCHGQTIHHSPDSDPPFSLQIGNGQILANETGYSTVTDFRAADIASGGQGAPLVPAFHEAAFSSKNENRAVVNIGGISNITFLPAGKTEQILGFDTGPGNTLIDYWCRTHFRCDYDKNGDIARTGDLQLDLLDLLLRDPYFERPPPKSTGQEYFNANWLKDKMSLWEGRSHSTHEDVLTTITMLTARCIIDQLKNLQPRVDSVYLAGGGANNGLLKDMIKDLSASQVSTTDDLGIHPQWVEAAAFAWMAYRTIHDLPSTLPSVTGASNPTVAGKITVPDQQPAS